MFAIKGHIHEMWDSKILIEGKKAKMKNFERIDETNLNEGKQSISE